MIDNLPVGWAHSTIRDLCQVNPKHDRHLDDSLPVSFVPMAAVSDVHGEIVSPETRLLGDVRSGFTHFADGDVIFAKITPCMENGKAASVRGLLNGIACGTTEFFVLRSHGAIDQDYLFYFIRQESYRKAARATMQSGVGQARVPKEFLESTEIPLPPLAEQRRIVAKIEALQERSRKAREALAEVGPLLEQFRQSLLAAAFRGDLTADWRAAHPHVEPATELLTRIRTERRQKWEQTELAKYEAKGQKPPKGWQDKYCAPPDVDGRDLPDLPDGWCWTSFDECAWEITVGHVGPMKHRYVTAGITMLRSQNVRSLRFDRTNCEFIPADFDRELSKSRLYGNEVLVVRSGVNVGDCCVYPADEGVANCSDLVITRPLSGLHSFYAAMYIESPIGKAALRLQRVGNAQPHFNVGSMKRSIVPLAPYDEQVRIVSIVENAFSMINNANSIQEALVELDRLDQSILAKAFRGELEPQDPNDEPASALLDRIRQQREAPVTKIGTARGRRRNRDTDSSS